MPRACVTCCKLICMHRFLEGQYVATVTVPVFRLDTTVSAKMDNRSWALPVIWLSLGGTIHTATTNIRDLPIHRKSRNNCVCGKTVQ